MFLKLCIFLSLTTMFPCQEELVKDKVNETLSGEEGAASGEAHPQYRLPSTLKPKHYFIRLQPFIHGNLSTHGYVEITFEAVKSTSVITLHMLDIVTLNDTLKVVSSVNQSEMKVANQTYQKEVQFYRIFLEDELQAGQEYNLQLSFIGTLNKKLKGFYPSSYTDDQGNIRRLAATQFQIGDARRAFPCFDEPAFKANFTVNIVREANMTALSNMPKNNTTPVQNSPGWYSDHFETSVVMSTYIVAFMVSDFVSINKTIKNDVLFRIWSTESASTQLDYPMKVGPALLDFYERFLNATFALPKLDMIALPDFSFGAMENWGLVNYRESLLVYNDQKSSAQNKWRVGHIIAHELAHMWFGNEVTPGWWSEIWLSEGFANYMETIGFDEVEPSYRAYEECIIRSSRAAFAADSTAEAHPMSFPTEDPGTLNDIISGVVYHKAGTLLRMLTYALTKDVFQKGLSKFVQKFSFSTAISEDLWISLNEERLLNDSLPDGMPSLSEVMYNWTHLSGYPVLHVNVSSDGFAVLSQQRFLFVKPVNQSALGHKWWIPITFTTEDNANFKPQQPSDWLSPNEETKQISGLSKNGSWAIFNIHQNGFFRVNYDETNWNKIVKQFNTNHSVISPVNRAQIIGDAFQLAKADMVAYTVPMALVGYLKDESDLIPLKAAFQELKMVENLLKKTTSYPLFKKYASEWNSLLFAEVGFMDDMSDSNMEQRKRSLIVKEACESGNKVCLQNSLELFQLWMRNPENESLVFPNIEETVWCSAIQHGGPEEWDFLWRRFINSNVGSEKPRLMRALGCTNNDTIRLLYLNKAFTENSEIRSQDASQVFNYVSTPLDGAKFAWSYFTKNFKKVYQYIGYSRTIGSMIKSATRYFNSLSDLKELNALILQNEELRGRKATSTAQVVEEIEGRIKWMENNYLVVSDWLQSMSIQM